MRRVFCAVAVATCVLVAVSLAGCGDDDDSTASATSTPADGTETVQPTIRPEQTATATPSASPTTPGIVRCETGNLSLAINPAGAAAGTHFISIALTNTGKESCLVSGYPGVSLIDAGGNQVGEPAERSQAIPAEDITLKSGESAHALVGLPNYQNFPAGKCAGPATGIKVFPPEETDARTEALDDYACPGFSVRVFEPGAEGHS